MRQRNGEERERLSLERSLEPLEPIEPIAGSKTKTKINPLKRMEGDALLPTTFILKVTILIKAINRNKPFCLTCGSPLILYVQDYDASHSTLLPGRQYHE